MLFVGQSVQGLGPVPCAYVPATAGRARTVRLAALSAAAMAIGAGLTILGVSFVQAGDDAGVREFQQQEALRGRAGRQPHAAAPVAAAPVAAYRPSNAASFYAPPAPRGLPTIVFGKTSGGKLIEPPINLNPFQPTLSKAERKALGRALVTLQNGETAAGFDRASGASASARSICVRLCDGFHAPIGNLSAASDLPAHEALCRAANPGIPVKIFRVAAGAQTIDGATSADGRTYASLPMAYAFEKKGDQACRPSIVQANERRVSLLRDFTLRAGDTVVLDGHAKVFGGSAFWPYQAADFSDFRRAGQLSPNQRRNIDRIVGISAVAAAKRAERRSALVREASLATLRDGQERASDVGPFFLRGSVDVSTTPAQIRVIAPETLGGAR